MQYLTEAASERLVPLLHNLLITDNIRAAQLQAAQAVGAEEVLLFTKDPQLDVLLPAPGFPGTLKGASAWHEFLNSLRPGTFGKSDLISPWSDTVMRCLGAASFDGTVLVLLGGAPDLNLVGQLVSLLPLVGRALHFQLQNMIAGAELLESRLAIERANVLTQSLNGLRQELQIALDDAVSEKKKADAAATEVRRINEELQAARDVAVEASRAKSSFLANMSHELRTPLNAIIGYAEMLHEEFEAQNYEHLSTDVQKIRNSGAHLLGLISDILDLSKIEAGKMELELSRVQASEILDEVLQLVEPAASQRGNHLSVTVTPPQLEIVSDRSKLRQVLVNLVSNGVKFTRGGTVSISGSINQVDEGKRCVVFTVADTGIGMQEDQLPRLFQDFSQLDSKRGNPSAGTGLGLAISKRLTEIMGGEIRVATVYGGGSTFTVTLPGMASA